MRKFIFILTILCFTIQSKSQTIFQETIPFYSTSGSTTDLTLTDDGGYVILRIAIQTTGNRYSIHLIKTNTNGALQWVNAFVLQNTLNSFEGLSGFSVKQTTDGGYIITGNSLLAGNAEILLIKTNNVGSMIWNKYYGSQITSNGDYGNEVIQTIDGGYLIIGKKNVSNSKLWLIKTNSTGTVMWERIIYQSGVVSKGFFVRESNSGEYYIFGMNDTNTCLIKTDISGNTIWSKSYPNNGVLYYGEPTLDGGCILSYNGWAVGACTQLLKIKSNGSVDWSKQYFNSGNITEGNCIKQTTDKGFVICGNSNGFVPNKIHSTLLKTDSLGNINFYNMYGSYNSSFKAVKQTADKGYITVGDSAKLIYFIKTDSLGISGCNETPQTLTVSPQTVSATSITLTNTAGTSFSTGTLSITSASLILFTVEPQCLTVGLLEKNDHELLKIFPNPTNGQFTFQIINNTKKSKLKLINIAGEVIIERSNISNETNCTINIEDQPSGIYLLELNQDGIISRSKLIKI